ncbi:hypothetical protein TNCV_3637031 [Trichonephila clavipes]|nr:hypothetical protein TNCV_3637031 [Trichonephila clavipes]
MPIPLGYRGHDHRLQPNFNPCDVPKESSCAAEQFHSDASLELVDRRAPNNSKNWQWTMEGNVSTRRSTHAPHDSE